MCIAKADFAFTMLFLLIDRISRCDYIQPGGPQRNVVGAKPDSLKRLLVYQKIWEEEWDSPTPLL